MGYPNHLPRKLGFLRYHLYRWVHGDGEPFLRKFSQCLERSPHPEQELPLTLDSEEFSQATVHFLEHAEIRRDDVGLLRGQTAETVIPITGRYEIAGVITPLMSRRGHG